MFKHKGYEMHINQYGKFWAIVDEEKIYTDSMREMEAAIEKRLKARRIKISIPAWFYIGGKVVNGHYRGVHKGWNAHAFTIGKEKQLQAGAQMFLSKKDAERYRDLTVQIEKAEKEMGALLLLTRSSYIRSYEEAVKAEADMVKRLTDGNTKTNP